MTEIRRVEREPSRVYESDSYRVALCRAFRGPGVAAEPTSDDECEETKTVGGALAYPASTEGVVLHDHT